MKYLAWRKIIYCRPGIILDGIRVGELDSTIDTKVKEGRAHLTRDRDFEHRKMLIINKECSLRTKP